MINNIKGSSKDIAGLKWIDEVFDVKQVSR